MNDTIASHFGPLKTPPVIKHLIIWTCVITLLSAAVQSVFDQFGLFPGPQYLLSLSWEGLSHFLLWQPLSFFFIQPSSDGITFSFLLTLILSMYLLWILGSTLVELTNKNAFLRFYFICGIGAGILTLLFTSAVGRFPILAGTAPVLLALITAWSMAYPENEILLFFLIPVRAKWIMAGLLGAVLLVALSQWDLTGFVLCFSGAFLGYAYACMAWNWRSPFHWAQKIDLAFIAAGHKVRQWSSVVPSIKSKTQASEGKIVDLSGKAVTNDEAFIDEMLAKISTHGEHALSWSEKRRMQQISERKAKEQK